MSSHATSPVATHAFPAVSLSGGVWILSYFVAHYLFDAWAPAPHWDIAVMSIPILTFFGFVWLVQRKLHQLDELQRRVHLEALAMAFLTTMLAMMGLGLIEETPRGLVVLPWRYLWFALVPIYGFCYAIAAWHYR